MRYVAITSGKGGTGKTAVTINLAICLSRRGQRVLIFDGDLGLANVDIQLGISSRFNLSHVVTGQVELSDILVAGPTGVHVLPGASGVVEMENLTPEMHGHLLNGVKSLEERFDIVLIDTGAGISNSVQLLNSAADEVIVVLTPDPSALMDAYAMVKLLATRCNQVMVRVIVNQVRSLAEANDVFERLRRVTKQFLPSELELIGAIGFDPQMQDAVRQGKPGVLLSPNSPSTSDLHNLATKWLAMPTPVGQRQGSKFWERVLDRK